MTRRLPEQHRKLLIRRWKRAILIAGGRHRSAPVPVHHRHPGLRQPATDDQLRRKPQRHQPLEITRRIRADAAVPVLRERPAFPQQHIVHTSRYAQPEPSPSMKPSRPLKRPLRFQGVQGPPQTGGRAAPALRRSQTMPVLSSLDYLPGSGRLSGSCPRPGRRSQVPSPSLVKARSREAQGSVTPGAHCRQMDPRDEPAWAGRGDSRTELEELQEICAALVTSLTALTDALEHLIASEPQHRAARIDA